MIAMVICSRPVVSTLVVVSHREPVLRIVEVANESWKENDKCERVSTTVGRSNIILVLTSSRG